jgi:transposase
MWNNANRALYKRAETGYPSDVTDAEWSQLEPRFPPAKHGGRPRSVDLRRILNALLYVLSTGCQWRAIPKDLASKSTVYDYFVEWRDSGVLDLIHHDLYVKCRELEEREASPTAGIIDSQSVKSAEKGGPNIDPSGYDAGKKIKGKKRHVLVDTLGLLLCSIVHAADIQDRDGGVLLMKELFGQFPFLQKLYADSGYRGSKFRNALKEILPNIDIEIVKRSDKANGFAVLPKRWIVERTIGWLNRCRRLSKDFENLHRSALGFLKLASIRFMVRRLGRAT